MTERNISYFHLPEESTEMLELSIVRIAIYDHPELATFRFSGTPAGFTLPVYNAGVIQKTALRTKTGATFGGDIVATMLAGGRLYLAIHAHRGWQKDVQNERPLEDIPYFGR